MNAGPAVVLREAHVDEWPAVGELTHAAYAALFGREDLGWYGEELRDVAGRAGHGRIVVAERDGALVGAVSYLDDYGADPAMVDLDVAGTPGFRVLAVPPEARGLGVGRLLTEWCIERARASGAASMVIHTTDYMDVAQAMYRRMGFERDERLDFHIERPPVHVKGYRLALQAGS